MDKNAIKSIIKNHDAKRLCELDEASFDDFMIIFTYEYLHKMKSDKLNALQKRILTCTNLEDACQADGILNLTEDKETFFALPETVNDLEFIGATQTADALRDFIALVPKESFEKNVLPKQAWFYDDETRKNEVSRIDDFIASYPDGKPVDLFRKLITSDEKKAEELLEGIAEASEQRTGAESLKIALSSLAVFTVVAAVYCVARFGFGFEFLALFNFPRTWISAVAVGAMCPLFLSLFFFGRYCKECGKSKIAYELLTSISAILLAASLLHMLLSLTGILG